MIVDAIETEPSKAWWCEWCEYGRRSFLKILHSFALQNHVKRFFCLMIHFVNGFWKARARASNWMMLDGLYSKQKNT